MKNPNGQFHLVNNLFSFMQVSHYVLMRLYMNKDIIEDVCLLPEVFWLKREYKMENTER